MDCIGWIRFGYWFAALSHWFIRCAQTCGLFAALSCVGVASMPFFDSIPWRYEPLLKSARLVKTLFFGCPLVNCRRCLSENRDRGEGVRFRVKIFRSIEANSCSSLTKLIVIACRKTASAVDHLFSDSRLGVPAAFFEYPLRRAASDAHPWAADAHAPSVALCPDSTGIQKTIYTL